MRQISAWFGASALALAAMTAGTAGAETAPPRPLAVKVSEGTHLAFALSPDRKQIVIDLQGVLHVMPAAGGPARPITDTLYDAREPSWSPDGKSIAFQSNRSGHIRIWIVDADGRNARPLNRDDEEQREPDWSPDGKSIAYTSNRGGKFDIWAQTLADGSVKRLSPGAGGNSRATWSPDGSRIAYVSDRMGATGIYAADMAGAEVRMANANVMAFGMTVPMGTPSWTPDGKAILYARIADGKSVLMRNDAPLLSGEDVHPFRVQWLSNDSFLYTADGKIKRRSLDGGGTATVVPFSAEIRVAKPAYAKAAQDLDSGKPHPVVGVQRAMLSPDGRQIAFTALGDLWVMPVGGAPRRLTDGGPYVVADPAWSPDGSTLVYASDRAGSLDLWTIELASGASRRITKAPGAEMRASFSPDGGKLVYVDASGAYNEQVHVLDLASGQDRLIKEAGDSPGYPAFTPDGQALLVSWLHNPSQSQAYVVGGYNQAMVVPLDGAKGREIMLAPGRSAGNRSGDGPVLSPDGKTYAYQMSSALWVQPANPDGTPAGAPRKLADTIPTGLSWSGDSKTLLAGAGNRLSLVDAATGAARPVALPLTWTVAKAEGVTTIHTGLLVDGVRDKAIADVDIVVTGSRITAIHPHGTKPVQGRYVDASGLTAIPGLMDMHVHLIKEYGAAFGRLYLAYGITTIRSPGNVPGDILEEKEAIAAGRRIGPRIFGTGYILDGERTVWEMGTPVATKEEAERQVALASTLGYDMIKSYVHTSEPVRQAIVAAAHRVGLHVSSHEIFPAAQFGSDSVEHLDGNGAGRGFSAKASQLNIAYEDSIKIIATSGITVTPTMSLFTPTAELVDHDTKMAKARDALQPVWVRGRPIMSFANGPGAEILAANIRQSIRRIHAAGGKIVVGTDSPFTPIGINTHNELVQEVKAGLTPLQALQSATRVPAELLGVAKDLGTVEVGKIADLVFVEGNPLDDIRNASKVRKVMKNGTLLDIEDIVRVPVAADAQ